MILAQIIELLAPLECAGCTRQGAAMCAECLATAVADLPEVCYGCGRASVDWRTCEQCSPDTELAGVTVGASYDGPVKELVLQLKFHRLRRAAEAAAQIVAARSAAWPAGAMVTSVPIAASRYRERGYNQSELVARQVAKRLGLPYLSLLRRTTATHQIGLDRRSRLEQIAGVFYAPRAVEARPVVVIDDVVTTGATLAECAVVLRAAGAMEVWGAAIARH